MRASDAPAGPVYVLQLHTMWLADPPVHVGRVGGQAPETGRKSVDLHLLHGRRPVVLLVQHVVRAVEAQHDGLGRGRRRRVETMQTGGLVFREFDLKQTTTFGRQDGG